jgi:hypothetical protein
MNDEINAVSASLSVLIRQVALLSTGDFSPYLHRFARPELLHILSLIFAKYGLTNRAINASIAKLLHLRLIDSELLLAAQRQIFPSPTGRDYIYFENPLEIRGVLDLARDAIFVFSS